MTGGRLIMLVVVSLVAFSYYVVISSQNQQINMLSEIIAAPDFDYGCIAEGRYDIRSWSEPRSGEGNKTVTYERHIIHCGTPEGCGAGFEVLREYSRDAFGYGMGSLGGTNPDKWKIRCPGDEWYEYLNIEFDQ